MNELTLTSASSEALAPISTKKQKNILSVDGGGVRAIIPTGILNEISRRTGLAVHEIFEGFAGTSTGALILNALLLPGDKNGAKYTPDDLYKHFDKELPAIFSETLIDELENGFDLLKPKYRPEPLESVVYRLAGEALFKDQIRDICVPSFDLLTARPVLFTRNETRTQAEKEALKVYDVVLASSAAPTYFPPHKMELNNTNLTMVDGGIYANNPASWAISNCNEGEEPFLLSIGTGLPPYSFKMDCPYEEGMIGWAPKLENLLFSSMIAGTDELMKRELKQNYVRIDIPIGMDHDQLDDASMENIQYLKNTVEEWIKSHDDILSELCKRLSRPTYLHIANTRTF